MKNDVFNLILSDLEIKPLFLVGGRGSGKTTLAKFLLKLAKEQGGETVDIRCFDPSVAWWHNAPLKNRQIIDGSLSYTDKPDTLYAIGKLTKDQVREFFIRLIGGWFYHRHDGLLSDAGFLSVMPLSLPVLEEAQDITKKSKQPDIIAKWINEGRNFKMSAILCTQRPAEIDTSIIERCNLLVGYVEGHRNKQKIEGATSTKFMKALKKVGSGSYEFVYYNGEVYEGVKGDDLYYPSPMDLVSDTKENELSNTVYQHPQVEPQMISPWWFIAFILMAGTLLSLMGKP